jgi:hypothetical protein
VERYLVLFIEPGRESYIKKVVVYLSTILVSWRKLNDVNFDESYQELFRISTRVSLGNLWYENPKFQNCGSMLHDKLFNCENKKSLGDSLASTRILLEFARDLRELVEDFEEEMEILSKKELIEQIHENRREKEKGNIVTFDSLEDLEKELEL